MATVNTCQTLVRCLSSRVNFRNNKRLSCVIMSKPIKSSARRLIYTMMCKFKAKQEERASAFREKERYFHEIMAATERIRDKADDSSLNELNDINNAVKSLQQLEENSRLKTEIQFVQEISAMTDVGTATIKRIKKEGQSNAGVWNTPGKKRPHKPTVANLDSFDINAIRQKINEYYTVKKQVPTLRTLLTDLRESIGFTGCRETLRKILLSNGFEFKKNINERSIIMERYDIAAWRHRFLRAISKYRQQEKPLIYLDETYIHQNYRPKKSWQGPSTSGVIEKISPGKRFIIVHAGSEKGFVPNALLVFSTKSMSADYHHDMNRQNFLKWLQEKLIPNLREPSVIIMDNASYHSTQVNKPPTMHQRKAEIQDWLTTNGIDYETYMSKEELMCLVDKYKPDPKYEVDEILKENGHEVLRLPPYHCDLNAIEQIWSLAKRKVGSKNMGLSVKEVEKAISTEFGTVTPEDWKKCTDHVLHVEQKYIERDGIVTTLEPFIINVTSDRDSSSESEEPVEFLESDFDYDS
ncbi:uncharacterized protein LOC134671435 [Cydia fagiglandana]|uniref:uncharacterized protein LOC134671435 n=2 Tax=Cydia fagiglandana TaxID=1458189 RepID=UPI002FEE3641